MIRWWNSKSCRELDTEFELPRGLLEDLLVALQQTELLITQMHRGERGGLPLGDDTELVDLLGRVPGAEAPLHVVEGPLRLLGLGRRLRHDGAAPRLDPHHA